MLFILFKKSKFANNKQHLMKSKKQVLFPKHLKIFEQVGENIKLARKRRKLTTIQVAERADINRATLYQIEKGNPSVSMGAYFNVLRVLGLQDDFLKLAADDELGRKLQDLELLGKRNELKQDRHLGLRLLVGDENTQNGRYSFGTSSERQESF